MGSDHAPSPKKKTKRKTKQKRRNENDDPNKPIEDEFIRFDDYSDGPSSPKSAPPPLPPPPRAGDKRKRDRYERPPVSAPRPKRQHHTPWVYELDWSHYTNVAEMLNSEVTAFVHYISPSPQEDEVRALVVEHIRRVIRHSYPDAIISPFGSYETKLYLPSGDIDLVISSPSMAAVQKERILRSLASILRRAGITDRCSIIARAKVPIIKFVTSHGRLNVDISLNQMNGIAAGKMINRYLNTDDNDSGLGKTLRALVLITKAFLTQRGLNEVYSGGLGSYAIVCIVMSFLQMHPKIRQGHIDPEKNLGVLLLDFFELYGRLFDYKDVGICLRNGGSYFSKRIRGWYDDQRPLLLSIEDPLDISNDVSKGSFQMSAVKFAFNGAYTMLTSAAYQRSNLISSRDEDHSIPLDRRYHPEDLSLLSQIVFSSQEAVNHRTLINEVYSSGRLHRLLNIDRPPSPVPTAPARILSPGIRIPSPSATHRRVEKEQDVQELSSDDSGGKYNIKKRVDKPPPAPQDFTTDDDEVDELDSDTEKSTHQPPPAKRQRTTEAEINIKGASKYTNNRDYWLSKGLPGGPNRDTEVIMVDDDDDD